MSVRHLELVRNDDVFSIKINSMVGRISLFVDNPMYKFRNAINMNKGSHQTSGRLSLVPLKTKNLYILEDADHKDHRTQNFIYVSDELSGAMQINSFSVWLRSHAVDFFTRSISVVFVVLYLIYYLAYLRYFNTVQTLYVLRYVTGTFTLVFAVLYYYLRSVKTKSSLLKFCFQVELFFFIVGGLISTVEQLSNATETF